MKRWFGTLAIVLALLVALGGLPAPGARAETSGDYEYTLLEDGTAAITAYTGSDADVVIPSELDGHTVTVIESYAFEENEALISVTIPEGVTTLSNYSFNYNDSLELIRLPASLQLIESPAWYGNPKLEVEVAEGNPVFEVVDGALIDKERRALISLCWPDADEYVVPEGVEIIERDALSDLESLRSVVIPEGVTTLAEYAVSDCYSLELVTLPASLKSVGWGCFSGCDMLELEVAEGNPVFEVVDGALIDRERRALVACCPLGAEEYVVPEGVEIIESLAFGSAYELRRIILPEGVTTLKDNALEACFELEELSLPASLTSIGSYSFPRDENLALSLSPENTSFKLVEGILFDAAMERLVWCPYSLTGEYTVPGTVKEIAPCAFSHCRLTRVNLPSGVERIGDYAFNASETLTAVAIPASVKEIGEWAFAEIGEWIYDEATGDYNFESSFELIVESGSVAETYAIENGIAYTLADASAFEAAPASAVDDAPAAEAENDQPGADISGIVSVGDTIMFGHYEQDDREDNGGEEIAWQVLEVDEKAGKVLVISKHILDIRDYDPDSFFQYGGDYSDHSNQSLYPGWADSDIRAWLNGEFLNAAFTGEEQGTILATTVSTDTVAGNYEDFHTVSAPDTEDKLFLLSTEEANLYFHSDDGPSRARRASNTKYAAARINFYEAKGASNDDRHKIYLTRFDYGDKYSFTVDDVKSDAIGRYGRIDYTNLYFTEEGGWSGWWWLRDPGRGQYATIVDQDGSIYDRQTACGFGLLYVGVRPAMWMDLREAQVTTTYRVVRKDTVVADAVMEPEPHYEELSVGSKGDDVKKLQEALIALGFLDDVADGSFGPKSERAVKAAQEALGLEADGIASEEFQILLYEMLEAEKAEEDIVPEPIHAQKGGTIIFGRYEQDGDDSNGKEPVEWLVLDVDRENNKALVISQYALDTHIYSKPTYVLWKEDYESRDRLSWWKSEARRWLNDEFVTDAFSPSERKLIVITDISEIEGGPDARDRVFMLSVDQAMQYLPSNEARKAVATASVQGRNGWWLTDEYQTQDGVTTCRWLLRQDNESWDRLFYVDANGVIFRDTLVDWEGYQEKADLIGWKDGGPIRPVMWIYVDSIGDDIVPEEMPVLTWNLTGEGFAAVETHVETTYETVEDVSVTMVAPQRETSGIEVGDRMIFGHYEQDGRETNGPEEIEWLVLRVEDGKALLVTKDLIEWKQFVDGENPYTYPDPFVGWADSDIRAWLNDAFLNTAFTPEEQEMIRLSDIVTPGNAIWTAPADELGLKESSPRFEIAGGGPDTQDKVFLMSTEEALTYIDSDADRAARPSRYAERIHQDNYVHYGAGFSVFWWLRSPGVWAKNYNEAMIVRDHGEVAYKNNNPYAYAHGGVRPAIWLDISEQAE